MDARVPQPLEFSAGCRVWARKVTPRFCGGEQSDGSVQPALPLQEQTFDIAGSKGETSPKKVSGATAAVRAGVVNKKNGASQGCCDRSHRPAPSRFAYGPFVVRIRAIKSQKNKGRLSAEQAQVDRVFGRQPPSAP